MNDYSENSSNIDANNVFDINRLGIANDFEAGKSLTFGLDYKFDQLEPQRNQFDNDTEYVGNEMDDFLDDDYSEDDAFSKPKAKKRKKIKAKLKPKEKKKLLTDGPGKNNIV